MSKFKPGDSVKLQISRGAEPQYGWGEVKNKAIGVVESICDGVVFVDFPSQDGWMAAPDELTLVVKKHKPTVRKPKPKLVVGDKVKLVIEAGESPDYGWGGVQNGDVGVVHSIQHDGDIRVDFPEQTFWLAAPGELVKVGKETVGKEKVEGEIKAKNLYAVVHEDDHDFSTYLGSNRATAREVKAALGGKADGWIILKYKAVKEIR